MAENRLFDTNILVYAYDISERRRERLTAFMTRDGIEVDETWQQWNPLRECARVRDRYWPGADQPFMPLTRRWKAVKLSSDVTTKLEGSICAWD